LQLKSWIKRQKPIKKTKLIEKAELNEKKQKRSKGKTGREKALHYN
jgi:hypothetical protein